MTKVKFPKNLAASFYRKAKKVYPNEEFAILLAKKKGTLFLIEDLYYPPERLNDRSPDYVPVHPDWFKGAEIAARERGLTIVGDIHSHCYSEEDSDHAGTDPSEDDWEYAEYMKTSTQNKYQLMGIVRILNRGDKLYCQTRFWPAIDLPVTVT
jgi:proteasome lid subunit RPN8/RPN11